MPNRSQYEERRRTLDPRVLMAEAAAISGLSDYGDMRFVESMTRFLDRAALEVDFNGGGLAGFRKDILRYLLNRLRTQEDIKRHPEILREDVSDPIIVIGLPRTGTTKMQRMLATSPNVQKAFLWQLLNPARFPDAIPGQPDPRRTAAAMGDGIGGAEASSSKALQAAHELVAEQVEEELVLFDYVLDESVRGFNHVLPLFFYEEWVPGKDREADREAYRYLRTLFQYLQWQDGGRRDRPWILKCVSHLAHLDSLLEFFPKATIVHCHRDPRNSVPSFVKLMEVMWEFKTNVDKKVIGLKCFEWCSAAISRYLEARDRLGLDGRIVDVKYEHIRDDVMSVMRRVYERAGLELTNEAEQAMLEWEQKNEQGKHGAHVYSLEEYGLSEELIDRAFADYISRFIDRR